MTHAERVADALEQSSITAEDRPPVSDKAVASIIRQLVADRRSLTRQVMDLVAQCDRERQLRLGALAILVADEVISSGRARELAGATAIEQRAYLRGMLIGDDAEGRGDG